MRKDKGRWGIGGEWSCKLAQALERFHRFLKGGGVCGRQDGHALGVRLGWCKSFTPLVAAGVGLAYELPTLSPEEAVVVLLVRLLVACLLLLGLQVLLAVAIKPMLVPANAWLHGVVHHQCVVHRMRRRWLEALQGGEGWEYDECGESEEVEWE